MAGEGKGGTAINLNLLFLDGLLLIVQQPESTRMKQILHPEVTGHQRLKIPFPSQNVL